MIIQLKKMNVHSVRMYKKIINLIGIFLILFSLFSISYTHSDGTGEDKVQSQSSTLLPFHYFSEGSITQGILIILFWGLLIKGIYELVIMILGRALIDNK